MNLGRNFCWPVYVTNNREKQVKLCRFRSQLYCNFFVFFFFVSSTNVARSSKFTTPEAKTGAMHLLTSKELCIILTVSLTSLSLEILYCYIFE